jgi:hypothetical protein
MKKDRTKDKSTPKQNKWNDPFYYKSCLFKWFKYLVKWRNDKPERWFFELIKPEQIIKIIE